MRCLYIRYIYTEETRANIIVQVTQSTTSPPCSLDSLLEADDPQTLAALEAAAHELGRGDECVVPVSEHGLHVAGDALEDDGGDGHEGAVFFRDGEDAVLLCEHQGGGESGGLGAG